MVIGIGNELRGDDGVGVYIINKVMQHFKKFGEVVNINNLYLINAKTSPESFTDKIKNINPDVIIIIDCAYLNKNPGEIEIIDIDKIDNYSLSSHTLPISIFIKYLKKFINSEFIVVGIQPKVIDFTFNLSDEVKKAGDKVAYEIIKLIE